MSEAAATGTGSREAEVPRETVATRAVASRSAATRRAHAISHLSLRPEHQPTVSAAAAGSALQSAADGTTQTPAAASAARVEGWSETDHSPSDVTYRSKQPIS